MTSPYCQGPSWTLGYDRWLHMYFLNGPCREKTCFKGVFEKARLKPVSSATETSKIIEISLEVSLYIILSSKRITKALISLRGSAGWSAPMLFANPRRQVLSRRGPNVNIIRIYMVVIENKELYNSITSAPAVFLTLKAPRKMHLKMSSAEVVCCK